MARQWHCSWGAKASDNSITRGAVGPGMENVTEYCGGGGMWRINNILLNNQWLIEEIKEEKKKKYLQTNDNKITMTPNLWDAAKAALFKIIYLFGCIRS